MYKTETTLTYTLAQLQDLHRAGTITDAEFAARRSDPYPTRDHYDANFFVRA